MRGAWWTLGLAATAVVAGLAFGWADRAGDSELLARADRARAPGAAARPSDESSAEDRRDALALPRPAAGDADQGPPAGMTVDQWAALRAELTGRPGGADELARVRAYLDWSDVVARWRAAPDDAKLAQTVYAGLPDRLARREVSAPEARVLAAALLQTLENDPTGRAAALQAFDQALPTAAAPSARERAFQREQAAVVAAWHQNPVAARDPAALQSRIGQLRARHFGQDAASASPSNMPSPEVSR